MTRVRVCFPTTENVVFVDGIRSFPADKVPQSMMCRTGTSVAVVASGGYHAFVRSPTGCIERLFEHGRFRLDVSGPTDAGSSWELAVLMAHAAFAAGSLATAGTDPEAAPVLICATGQVGPLDLAVGEVAHVSHKVDLARPVLEAARARGQRVILAVPPGNRDDITSAARQALEAAGVEIVTPGNARSLAEAAGLVLPRLAEAASRGYTPGTNPYRGLLAFGAEDRGVFFGRRRAREEAVAQLQTAAVQGRPFLLIHGRSGIGKSSLLRAGLAGDVPERLGQGRDWRVLTLSLRGPGPAGPAHRQILGVFGAGLDTARDALATLGPGAMVLLLLDQLEQALIELSAPEAAALGALLQGLVASQRVWVIGAIRSDQLDTLDRVPDLARLARDGRLYRLEPPTLFELGEMIRQPAALAGLMFLPGPHGEALPDRLAQVALEAPGSVPLLQVMLMQLAAMADRQGRIPFDAYDRLGGINDAVMRLAEEAVAALPEGLREADLLDRALSALIQIDQDGERVLARALDPQQDRPDVARLLAHLVDRRIVIAETGPPPAKGGQDAAPVTLRLAHETLITGWRRLAVLADRLREDIILRGWLEAVAVDWNRAHHDPGLLAASPARLAAARKAVDAARIAFPDQATRYLAAAERKLDSERRKQRNRRGAVGAGVIVFVLALGAATVRLTQAVAERDVALTDAQTERRQAERNFATAQIAIDALIFDLVGDLRNVEGIRIEALHRILVQAERAMDSLLAINPDDPHLRRSQAMMRQGFADLFDRSGAADEASGALEQAVGAFREFAGAEAADFGARLDLANGLRFRAHLRLQEGLVALARPDLDEALALARGVLSAAPGQRRAQGIVADIQILRGDIARRAGDIPAATDAFDEALTIRRALAGEGSGGPAAQADLATILQRVGELVLRAGDTESARSAYAEALTIRRAIMAQEPENSAAQGNVASALVALHEIARRERDLDAARQNLQEALAIRRSLVALQPGDLGLRRQLSITLDGLGDLEVRAGNPDAARLAYDEALAIARANLQASPNSVSDAAEVANTLTRLGELDLTAGSAATTRVAFEEALGIWRNLAVVEAGSVWSQDGVAATLARLGRLAVEEGDVATAQEAYDEALTIRRTLATQEPGHVGNLVEIARILRLRGALEQRAGRLDAAQQAYLEVIATLRDAIEIEPSNLDHQAVLAFALVDLAQVHRRTGNLIDARNALEQALAIRRAILSREPDDVSLRYALAYTLNAIGDIDRDEQAFGAARSRFEGALGHYRDLAQIEPDNLNHQSGIATSLERLARLARATGETETALLLTTELLEMRRSVLALYPANVRERRNLNVALQSMAELALQTDEPETAEPFLEESLTLSLEIAALEPTNMAARRDVSVVFILLGDLYWQYGEPDSAREAYENALDIRRSLLAAEPENPGAQADLDRNLQRLESLGPDRR